MNPPAVNSGGQRRDDDPFTNAVDKAVGIRLRQLRKSRHLSQAQAGQAVGMSAQRWKSREDGVRISASRLWQFCVYLGVDVHDIFAGLPTALSGAPGEDDADLAETPAGQTRSVEPGSALAEPELGEFVDALNRLTSVERTIALAAIKGIAVRGSG